MADAGFQAQAQAWLDAAEHVDDKWTFAFAQADRVQNGYARFSNDTDGDITLGVSTHSSWFVENSALPLQRRPSRHDRRQVPHDSSAQPAFKKASGRGDSEHTRRWRGQRLSAALGNRTAAVLVSAVFYRDAQIVDGLDALLSVCQRAWARNSLSTPTTRWARSLLVVAPKLRAAFVVGGGYKYCPARQGNAFLRSPPGCRHRPRHRMVLPSSASSAPARPLWATEGGLRFAGATYDPTSHYRGCRGL